MRSSLPLRFLLVVGLILLLAGCPLTGKVSSRPAVLNGVIDVSRSSGSVDLAGRWAFWPSQFIYPSIQRANFGRYEQFPASWSIYNPEHFSAQGYGSYAVTITGMDPSILYAFRFPGYSCASRYFVNGKELYSQGTPAKDRASERPAWDSVVVPLPAAGYSEVTVVLHLSNFNDIYPASPTPLVFGSYDTISAGYFYDRILMIIPFGAILAMGVYFIALYVFHRQEYSSLWLGLLCMVFALRIICYDEFLIQDFLPGFPSALMFRFGYLTFSLAVASFTGFIRAQYASLTRKRVIFSIIGISLFYALCNMVLPVSVFSAILVPFQIFSIISSLYMIYIIVRAVISLRDGAWLFLAGFLFFFLVILRDILIANRLLEGVFLAHYGILGIILAMALIIVRHFSVAFNTVEAVTEELAAINTSLARFVPNEFLRFLGKSSITEICLGDNIQKDMCVMFVHLGMGIPLTGSASRLDMLEMFNSTLHKVNPVVQKYKGFVDKYLSEGLMVLFPDDPCNAVGCAMEIREVIVRYNVERDRERLPGIKFAAGVHRGALMLGTIGDSERMDGTVISDVVNIASRLQKFALSRDASIIISEAVSIPLGGSQTCPCSLIPHGEVRLKGRSQLISVFEVRGL